MYVKGEFQAKKLTKDVRDGKVYRKLWVKDQYDEDYQLSFSEELLPKLKPNGVYVGVFDFQQRDKYQGYGVEDRIILVDVIESDPKNWSVASTWNI